jgi:hypothetical protein
VLNYEVMKAGAHANYVRASETLTDYSSRMIMDRLCGLVVRIPGYISRGPGSILGATRFSENCGSGTGSTQPREYN